MCSNSYVATWRRNLFFNLCLLLAQTLYENINTTFQDCIIYIDMYITHTKTHKYVHVYVCIYIIYIKNYVWEDQSKLQYYICHIELQIPNSCILSNYSTGNWLTVLYWVVIEWLWKFKGDFITNHSQQKLLVLTEDNDSSITVNHATTDDFLHNLK